jgi:MFS transporter, ACS family, solute carrier family 17 (sodium-dependent inorganic phosphate cotransporter), other
MSRTDLDLDDVMCTTCTGAMEALTTSDTDSFSVMSMTSRTLEEDETGVVVEPRTVQTTTTTTTTTTTVDEEEEGTTSIPVVTSFVLDRRLDGEGMTVLLLLWFIAAISALDRVAMSVALVPMTHEYHLTDTMSGSISSLFSIGYGLAILPAGLLISYVSPKLLMTVGIFIWSIATLLTPIAAGSIPLDDTVPILCIRAIVGMGEAILIPTMHRLLSVFVPYDQKSLALAFLYSGFHIGTIMAYVASPVIMDTFQEITTMVANTVTTADWRFLFYVYGACGLLVLLPWVLLTRDQPTNNGEVSSTSTNSRSTTTNTITTPTTSIATTSITNYTPTNSFESAIQHYQTAPWKALVQSKGVWGMLLAHCAKNWGLYTSLSWTPIFYAEQYGMSVRDSAWLSVLPSVAGALGGFLAGTMADRTLKNLRTKTTTSTSIGDTDDTIVTQMRKQFQTVGLVGPAIALGALAYQKPDEARIAQLYLMVAVGLQSFNAGGFEAGTQDKAGKK